MNDEKINKISKPYSEYMESKIQNEGFHYAFIGYSNFEEVEDKRFHELRLQYIESTKQLGEYMDISTNLYF